MDTAEKECSKEPSNTKKASTLLLLDNDEDSDSDDELLNRGPVFSQSSVASSVTSTKPEPKKTTFVSPNAVEETGNSSPGKSAPVIATPSLAFNASQEIEEEAARTVRELKLREIQQIPNIDGLRWRVYKTTKGALANVTQVLPCRICSDDEAKCLHADKRTKSQCLVQYLGHHHKFADPQNALQKVRINQLKPFQSQDMDDRLSQYVKTLLANHNLEDPTDSCYLSAVHLRAEVLLVRRIYQEVLEKTQRAAAAAGATPARKKKDDWSKVAQQTPSNKKDDDEVSSSSEEEPEYGNHVKPKLVLGQVIWYDPPEKVAGQDTRSSRIVNINPRGVFCLSLENGDHLKRTDYIIDGKTRMTLENYSLRKAGKGMMAAYQAQTELARTKLKEVKQEVQNFTTAESKAAEDAATSSDNNSDTDIVTRKQNKSQVAVATTNTAVSSSDDEGSKVDEGGIRHEAVKGTKSRQRRKSSFVGSTTTKKTSTKGRKRRSSCEPKLMEADKVTFSWKRDLEKRRDAALIETKKRRPKAMTVKPEHYNLAIRACERLQVTDSSDLDAVIQSSDLFDAVRQLHADTPEKRIVDFLRGDPSKLYRLEQNEEVAAGVARWLNLHDKTSASSPDRHNDDSTETEKLKETDPAGRPSKPQNTRRRTLDETTTSTGSTEPLPKKPRVENLQAEESGLDNSDVASRVLDRLGSSSEEVSKQELLSLSQDTGIPSPLLRAYLGRDIDVFLRESLKATSLRLEQWLDSSKDKNNDV